MSQNIMFNKDRSNTFQTRMDSTMKSIIDGDLKRMKSDVERCKTWWKGSSEEGFIAHFEQTRVLIEKELTACVDKYKTLVGEVQRVLEEEEDEMNRTLASANQ